MNGVTFFPCVGKNEISQSGTCGSDCMNYKLQDQNMHVAMAINHMHYLGRTASIEHLRNGKVINVLADDKEYSYDRPVLYQ